LHRQQKKKRCGERGDGERGKGFRVKGLLRITV